MTDLPIDPTAPPFDHVAAAYWLGVVAVSLSAIVMMLVFWWIGLSDRRWLADQAWMDQFDRRVNLLERAVGVEEVELVKTTQDGAKS